MKTALLVVLLNLGAVGFAQQPRQDPGGDRARSETTRPLNVFVGTWSITEKYDPSDAMPRGGTGTGQEVWRAGPGGRSVIEEYHSTTSNGFGLGWWEDQGSGGGFRLNWCSDDDPHGCTRLSELAGWQGYAWVVRDTTRGKGGMLELKEVFSDITPTSFTQTLYQGPPGMLKRFLVIRAIRMK